MYPEARPKNCSNGSDGYGAVKRTAQVVDSYYFCSSIKKVIRVEALERGLAIYHFYPDYDEEITLRVSFKAVLQYDYLTSRIVNCP